MSSWTPDVVNSYQGAFGPPTLGHYQAMNMAAKQTLEDNSGNILMLFMPTAASSSKKHLAVTQGARIDALTLFCAGLKKDFPDPRIRFEASSLEYEIYTKTGKTATIFTIDALTELYKPAKIALTMGLDNLYDLPFWERAGEYATKLTAGVYVAMRDTTSEDIANTIEAKNLKFSEDKWRLRFNKFASWNSKKSTPLEAKSNELTSINSMKIIFLGKPVPTSSSLLRGALYKYYREGENPVYLAALKKLIGPLFDESDANNPWRKSIDNMVASETNVKKKANSFNKDYASGMLGMDGGRRKRKTRRSNKGRRRNSRKRI